MATPGDKDSAEHKMWGGRFEGGPSEAMAALNNSLPVDIRLWPYDIRGSKAWVSALCAAGVLTTAEQDTLHTGLDAVGRRMEQGAGSDATDEDVHSLVERLLYEEVGSVAGKLHTGRSRNDQVATDLRLWALDAITQIDREVRALGKALVDAAATGVDLVMPGYTHAQQAQPVRWAYVLLAHAWPLRRDLARLEHVQSVVSEMPLGSGALAGSGVPVDRILLKESLGFRAITGNALDATGDRDFVLELLFAVTMIATHLSRLGGEMVTLSSTEYGFVRQSDAFSTGSSLMPQKRNPDAFELARAKAARTLGSLVTVLSAVRSLPAGYSKDLQEDKPAVFDAVDTLLVTLPALRGAVSTMTPVPERMRGALQANLLATDVADELVARGVPFREAHGIVGHVVRAAEESGVALTELDKTTAAELHAELPAVLTGLGSFDESLERRVTAGGTSRASVEQQLAQLQRAFASD